MLKKIIFALGILVLAAVGVVAISLFMSRNAPAPVLAANFIDLDKIEKISKYRSCVGHTTVPQDMREMRRSMKHYFQVKPEYQRNQTVEIYSPYDGYVSVIRSDLQEEHPLEGEIWIRPKNAGLIFAPPFGLWQFSVQHIDVREGLKRGSEVKAGEIIGYAALSKERETFDIIYAKLAILPKKIDNWRGPFADLDSVFNHTSQEVLAEFEERGISKEEIILQKEERDQDPCVYRDQGPYFENQEDEENWIALQ